MIKKTRATIFFLLPFLHLRHRDISKQNVTAFTLARVSLFFFPLPLSFHSHDLGEKRCRKGEDRAVLGSSFPSFFFPFSPSPPLFPPHLTTMVYYDDYGAAGIDSFYTPHPAPLPPSLSAIGQNRQLVIRSGYQPLHSSLFFFSAALLIMSASRVTSSGNPFSPFFLFLAVRLEQ